MRQESEIEATTLTSCLSLLKGDFQQIVKDFPDLLEMAQRNVNNVVLAGRPFLWYAHGAPQEVLSKRVPGHVKK